MPDRLSQTRVPLRPQRPIARPTPAMTLCLLFRPPTLSCPSTNGQHLSTGSIYTFSTLFFGKRSTPNGTNLISILLDPCRGATSPWIRAPRSRQRLRWSKHLLTLFLPPWLQRRPPPHGIQTRATCKMVPGCQLPLRTIDSPKFAVATHVVYNHCPWSRGELVRHLRGSVEHGFHADGQRRGGPGGRHPSPDSTCRKPSRRRSSGILSMGLWANGAIQSHPGKLSSPSATACCSSARQLL
ncbi:hypothetical protein C8R43DRAFT_698056 [Mycena crocata]|nr:hypothetical protein C8R43DRAFT_698056 [Mycena crocata]